MKTVIPVIVIHDCAVIMINRKPDLAKATITFADDTQITVFGTTEGEPIIKLDGNHGKEK